MYLMGGLREWKCIFLILHLRFLDSSHFITSCCIFESLYEHSILGLPHSITTGALSAKALESQQQILSLGNTLIQIISVKLHEISGTYSLLSLFLQRIACEHSKAGKRT